MQGKRNYFNLILIATLLLSLVAPAMTQAFTPIGDPSNASLTITKYKQTEEQATQNKEATGQDQEVKNGTPVEGVVYELKRVEAYDPDSNKWTDVTEASFTETTDKNGQIKLNNLPLGKYEVVEKSAPASEGIVINDEPFFVDVPMTNAKGDELNYNVKVFPKNEIARGGVTLKKLGDDGKALKGATFVLYEKKNGKIVRATDNEKKVIPPLTTDDQGEITVEGLDAGDYFFVETKAAPGHALNNERVDFSIKSEHDKKNLTVTKDNYLLPTIEKDVEGKAHLDVERDKPYTYNITVTVPKDIDKYALYEVTDKLDDRLTFIENSVKVENGAGFKFSQDGQTLKWTWNEAEIQKLTPGKEIKISFDAKIKEDAVLTAEEMDSGISNTAELDFDNNRGQHTVPKVNPEDPNDPTDPNLPTDPNGPTPTDPNEPGYPKDPNEPNKPLVPVDPTDPDGPKEPGKPTTPPVTVKPVEAGLVIQKVDEKGNNLAGAVFELQDENGKVVTVEPGTLVKVNGEDFEGNLTDLEEDENEPGRITITGLKSGNYKLVETKAPQGYRLLTKAVDVELIADENVQIEVKNKKTGWNLPTTGGIGTVLFTAIGIALMAGALFMFLRRKNETA